MINTDNLSDEEIVDQGYACLLEHLGTIGTERFIAYIKREGFDYTQWRKGLFKDKSSEEIISAAAEYEEKHPFTPKKPQIPFGETKSNDKYRGDEK